MRCWIQIRLRSSYHWNSPSLNKSINYLKIWKYSFPFQSFLTLTLIFVIDLKTGLNSTEIMVTAIILFILCLVLSGIIFKIIKIKETTFSWPFCFALLGGKIIAACIYGYIYKHAFNGDDTWMINQDSFFQYHRLLHDTGTFFTELFGSYPQGQSEVSINHSPNYLDNLEYALITKGLAPFNLVSQGNYYINAAFFCFFNFWGFYFIYRLLKTQYKVNHRMLALLIFLFPPVAFWLSGLRADGYILLFLGILLYKYPKLLVKVTLSDILWTLFSFIVVFILRNGFALLLIPPLFAWWLHEKFGIKKIVSFAGTYFSCFILVLSLKLLLPARYDLISHVINRQHEFLALNGNTRYALTPLNDSFAGFAAVLPQAFLNVFFRPFPWVAKGTLQLMVTLENLFLWTLVIIVLVKYFKSLKALFKSFIFWALLSYSLTLYLFIGYTVPFPGAYARYRIIAEFFIIIIFSALLLQEIAKKYGRFLHQPEKPSKQSAGIKLK